MTGHLPLSPDNDSYKVCMLSYSKIILENSNFFFYYKYKLYII